MMDNLKLTNALNRFSVLLYTINTKLFALYISIRHSEVCIPNRRLKFAAGHHSLSSTLIMGVFQLVRTVEGLGVTKGGASYTM